MNTGFVLTCFVLTGFVLTGFVLNHVHATLLSTSLATRRMLIACRNAL
jgi:hypothetical protein